MSIHPRSSSFDGGRSHPGEFTCDVPIERPFASFRSLSRLLSASGQSRQGEEEEALDDLRGGGGAVT